MTDMTEMTKKYLMLCPVGTSGAIPGPVCEGCKHKKKPKEKKPSASKWTCENCGYENEIKERKYPTAEVQSTVLWIKEMEKKNVPFELKLYLLPSKSDDSRETANKAKDYFLGSQNEASSEDANTTSKFSKDNPEIKYFFGFHGGTIEIKEVEIEVSTVANFNKSVSELYTIYNDLIKEHEGYKTVINATGGFKSIVCYSAIYAQLNNLQSIYTFESNDKGIVTLLPLPISCALSALDEEITMLKCAGEDPGLFKNALDAGTLPDWFSGLIVEGENGKGKTSAIAEMLIASYSKSKESSSAGTGTLEILKEMEEMERGVNATPFYDYLSKRIVTEWSELWLGDQIPETVEHSRRHSKRLMEITGNLIRSAEKEALREMGLLKPQVLSLLIAAIFLHDIGHNVLSHPYRTKCEENDKVFPLGMFPSCVREVHNLLTSEMIRKRGEEFFPKEDGIDANMFRVLVPLISEHHRQYTSLKKGEKKDEESESYNRVKKVGSLLYGKKNFKETSYSLEEKVEERLNKDDLDKWELKIEDILNIAALLRFIDSCDVQKDRTVSKNYMTARQKRTKEEAQNIYPTLRVLESLYPESDGEKYEKYLQIKENVIELKKILDSINTDKTKLEDGISDKIKNYCIGIYEFVLDTLTDVKGSADILSVTSDNQGVFAYLSALNRFAFKCEQFRHFHKHNCVDFVLPLKKDGGISICLWPNEEACATGDDLTKIANDIEKERDSVFSFLKPLNIKVEVKGRDENEYVL